MPQTPAAPSAPITLADLFQRIIDIAMKAGAIIGDPQNRAMFRLLITAPNAPMGARRMESRTPIAQQHSDVAPPGSPAFPLQFNFGSIGEACEAERQIRELSFETPTTEPIGTWHFQVIWSCTLPIPHPNRGQGRNGAILSFRPHMPHIEGGIDTVDFTADQLGLLANRLAQNFGGRGVLSGGGLNAKKFYVHIHFLRIDGHALFEFETAEQAQAFEDAFTRPWAAKRVGFWRRRKLVRVGFGAHIFDGNGTQIWGLYTERMERVPHGMNLV